MLMATMRMMMARLDDDEGKENDVDSLPSFEERASPHGEEQKAKMEIEQEGTSASAAP